jgi:ABC-2 type transport system permease protein
MALLRALLYLRLTSIANVVIGRLRRLRQPKYLIGAIVGGAYIWFFFIRGFGPRTNSQNLAMVFADGRAEIFAALLLSLFITLIWVLPGGQPGLSFSEAEVTWLFPAPLTRRQIIHYKLLDGLFVSLLSAAFFALISAGLRQGWVAGLRHFGSWWVLNANISLHQSAAVLTIARLTQLGVRPVLRRSLLVGGIVAGVIALVAAALRFGPDAVSFVLWPARLVVHPFAAADVGAYALALLPALGLMALQYFWVLRLEAPFEDATLAQAQKTGERLAQLRAGKNIRVGGGVQKAQRPPFRLRDRLPPEFALLWKNLMAAPSYLNRWVFLGAALLLAAGVRSMQHLGEGKLAAGVGGVFLLLLSYVLIFGPHLARNDLRGDLLHADQLKAWPLPGWRIALGELLAPTMLLSAISWLLVFIALLALTPQAGKAAWLTPGLRGAILVALTVALPPLCALQLLVPNAATLLFPAWAQTGRPVAGGMDVMGQRLIFFLGQFICLLTALLPAVLAAGVTIFLTQWLIGAPAAVLLAIVPVLIIFGLEIGFGVAWVGRRFEKLDISAELRP